MKKLLCLNCGANIFTDSNEYKICIFCNSQYKPEENNKPEVQKQKKQSIISLQNDIDRLLQKCKENPAHASRYAELILDIDPTNNEARKYL